MSKIDKSEVNAQVAASIRKFSALAKDEGLRENLIIEMPEYIRIKAQLISAHFLLPAGARIVDIGCETGEISYMLAALNPRSEVVGVDRDADAIAFARKTYQLPNLSFEVGDATLEGFPAESFDGIVNSNILHHVYSQESYDPEAVTEFMEKQIARLKTGGIMLVRDYIKPPDDEFVLLELPDAGGTGEEYHEMSDAELLISFSQSARPMESGCEGFFIEEVIPERGGTRMFRLPHKWAKEFIHRKDYRAGWEKELRQEYTFFTWQDYRREFTRLGMRMVFSAPYWNPWVVKNTYTGRFQLYTEDGDKLPPPATNYFVVAQKVADKQSLILEERRPSQQPVGDLQIMVVKDKKSGVLHEIVRRPGEYCDIVPYRVTPDNRVVVYVRSGYPRPIVNAVSRGSANLDGKKWSGHLIEPITMDTSRMTGDVERNRRMIFDFVEKYAGLRAKSDQSWYVGETYFPSPDRIDEAIEPVFVEVENPHRTSWPIEEDKEVGFTEIGSITELDGADIILASQVGLLPEPRLEMHVFDLMSRNEIPVPGWIGATLPRMTRQVVAAKEPEELLEELPAVEFEQVDRAPVHLKPVKAVFVEEGRVGRSTRGLSSQDIEFVVTDDGVENIAVVLPITRDWDNNLLVMLEPKVLPVPNRMGGNGAMLEVPSFTLPRNVQSVQDAREYIAEMFRVPTEQVLPLGESYFTHTGVTPQRVYPFTVASPKEPDQFTKWQYTNIKGLNRIVWGTLFYKRYFYSVQLVKCLMNVHRMMLPIGHDHNLHTSPINLRASNLSMSTEKVAVAAADAGYAAPSRVLGNRGAARDFSKIEGAMAAEAAAAAIAREKAEEMWQPESRDEGEKIRQENSTTQKIIEGLMMPRIGKQLKQSYQQAMNLKDSLARISICPSRAFEAFEKDVDKVGEQLRKRRDQAQDPPDPPAPGKG